MSRTAGSPISFPVSVVRLPQKGMPVTIDADEAARAALAAAHDLTAVERFRADLLLEKWQGAGVRVSGSVSAAIEQACIVTLEPVRSAIHEAIDQIFLPPESRLSRIAPGAASELVLDVDGPDLPETLEGDTLDVGALAEEFFALGIDPYPRAAGAALPLAGEDADAAPSPFARLAGLAGKGR